jgi:hypothetical protein
MEFKWPSFVHEHTQGDRWEQQSLFKILRKATQRELALQKRRPREKIVTDERQRQLTFDP